MFEDARSAVKTTVVTVVALWTVGPLLYYSHCEFHRHRHIRRRKRAYAATLATLDRRKTLELPTEEMRDDQVGTVKEELRDELLEATKLRYASLKIGGRFQNPFDEWREEGAWEWVFWKVIYGPLLTRLPRLIRTLRYGTAPLPDPDADPLYRSHRPDWVHLFGVTSPEDVLLPSLEELVIEGVDAEEDRGIVTVPTVVRDEENGLSQSWDRLPTPPSPPSGPKSEANAPDAKPDTRIRVSDDFSFTWIGQSTCYIQIDGLCVLTDPIFSDRTVETWFAPSRLRPVPCALRELLKIDVVLVSHSHFDHLDVRAIEYLGNRALWIIPTGLGDWFRDKGVYNVREMNWWDSTTIPIPTSEKGRSVEIVALPTMHWTARNPFDVNRSLWNSFAVIGPRHRFFHVGDTGYCPVFASIGDLYGPFDLAAVPIGAYEPRWHLRPQHIGPDEAIKIMRDLRATKAIAVHWGTWVLSDERWDEPPKELRKELERQRIEEGRFELVPSGKTLVLRK